MWPDDEKQIIAATADLLEPLLDAATDIVDGLAAATKTILVCIADKYKELELLAYEAQEKIDARAEERERWGHPPKRLIAAYTQPAKTVRPCARSFCRR